jgi:hypothetical protein
MGNGFMLFRPATGSGRGASPTFWPKLSATWAALVLAYPKANAIACERMEGEAAAGNPIDLDAYGTLTDRLGRAFQRLGLRRQPREVGPTLGDILRQGIEQRS